MLDCGRVVVNATMLRRIGGLLREQDRRDDRHTEDVHILCIDVIIASDMLTSKLCSGKLCLGLNEKKRLAAVQWLSIINTSALPFPSLNVLVSWILDFGFWISAGKGGHVINIEMDMSCGTKGHVL